MNQLDLAIYSVIREEHIDRMKAEKERRERFIKLSDVDYYAPDKKSGKQFENFKQKQNGDTNRTITN